MSSSTRIFIGLAFAVDANYYEDRLGPGITRDMASWVRQEDPNAVLFFERLRHPDR